MNSALAEVLYNTPERVGLREQPQGVIGRGTWDFYITNGKKPLTKAEVDEIKAGRKIKRAYRRVRFHNLIVDVGLTQLAKILAHIPVALEETYITHQELGTSTAAPAAGNTGLTTPDAATRKAVSSLGWETKKLNITSFWAAGEATGTWREMATFINGTGTSNSGTCFNRAAINVTITAGQSLTVDGTVDFTST